MKKEILSLAVGSIIIILYLLVLSLIIGESPIEYFGNDIGLLIFVISTGSLIGRYIINKILDL